MLENGAHVLCVGQGTEPREALTASLPCVKFTFADSFAIALQLLRSGVFDLYLLNEDCAGIELCCEIRMTDANTPVVLLSSPGQAYDRAAAFAAGASRYLDMPADFFLLESTVMGLLSRAEARNFNARMAEIAAVREEIRQHLDDLDERTVKNMETTISGINHLLRARAYDAFIDSGGVKSQFERLWSEIVGESQEDL